MHSPDLTVAVGPAGQWGSAFAKSLAENKPYKIKILIKPEDLPLFEETRTTRRLPGYPMPANVVAVSDKREFIQSADLFVVATSAQKFRPFYEEMRPIIPSKAYILSLPKGIEQITNFRMTQIILEKDPGFIDRIAVLSGPNQAIDVAKKELVCTTVAAYDINTAKKIQDWLNSYEFRVYITDDVIGVEYAAMIKNIEAVGAGIIYVKKKSPSTKAFYFTRCVAERKRFVVALGGSKETSDEPAGIGDEYLSMIGPYTRNFRAGMRIANGWSKKRVMEKELSEGLNSIGSAIALAEEHSIDIPIIRAIDAICNGESVEKAQANLMGRPPSKEINHDKSLTYGGMRLFTRLLYKLGIRLPFKPGFSLPDFNLLIFGKK